MHRLNNKQQIIMSTKFIQNYELLEEIGQSSHGKIYKAKVRGKFQFFSIKMICKDRYKQYPENQVKLKQQCEILKRIKHKNVIKFYQVLQTYQYYYLVYQYCNGGSLRDLLEKQKIIPQERAIHILSQIRKAFEYLYNQKIMHRNLKPSKILFHDDSPKIADFGICKDLDQAGGIAQSRMIVNVYSSPEVVKGGVYDSRADLWSLGVIIYEMLYGKVPFNQSEVQSFADKNSENKKVKYPVQNDNISQHTKKIISRLLSFKYRERMPPLQFIKFGLTSGSQQAEVEASKNKLGFKFIALFVRRSLSYVAQTLYDLAQFSHSSVYLILSFMVFKVFYSIQKDVKKNSAYWKILNIQNTEDKWDFVIDTQMDSISGYGDMVKQALIKTNISDKVKLQIETRYISDKYYLELINVVLFDIKLKNKLVNVFLINKHIVNVLENNICNFTDYTISDLSLQEKIQLCQKYIRYM